MLALPSPQAQSVGANLALEVTVKGCAQLWLGVGGYHRSSGATGSAAIGVCAATTRASPT